MKRLLCAFVISLPMFSAWAEQAVQLSDFAYAADLQTDGAAAIYRLQLPQAVYRDAVQADLSDLRVFNADGLPVPHGLIRSGRERSKSSTRYDLPLFPLYADTPSDSSAIRVRIERAEATHSIALEQSSTAPDRRISGYILDARALHSAINRFTFNWAQQNFLTRLDLDSGNDLEHWRTLATNLTLADLNHLGHHLKRNRISVKPIKARYFRLRFHDPEKAITVTGAQAHGTHFARITHYSETSIAATHGEQAGAYRFDIPNALPADELRITLPEVNSLASARLESRASASKPWRLRRELTLYRLRQNGVEVENDDVNLAGAQDRQWRLLVDQSAGGLGAGLPRLDLRWRAHELQFVARGNAPFTLAWGSAKKLPREKLQPKGIIKTTGLAPAQAQITGAVRRVSGDAVLDPPINWRQGLLWGVLIAAALLLVSMAVRLFRQMND